MIESVIFFAYMWITHPEAPPRYYGFETMTQCQQARPDRLNATPCKRYIAVVDVPNEFDQFDEVKDAR